MNTIERLQDYGVPFSDATLEVVGDVADRQQQYEHYGDFFHDLGIDDPRAMTKRGLVDLNAEGADPDKTLIYFTPFNQTLDTNQLFQLGTVASVLPDHRVIGYGNSSGPGFRANALNMAERYAVRRGDLSVATETLARYVDRAGIGRAAHAGYAFAANMAVAAAERGTHDVTHLSLINPDNVLKSNTPKLARNFYRSAEALDGYVDAVEAPIFKEARRDAEDFLPWVLGLASLSNRAYVEFLTQGTFASDISRVMGAHPELHASIAYGDRSEMTPAGPMYNLLRVLKRDFEGRVDGTAIHGGKYALGNDIYVQAALIREAIAV